MPGCMVYRARIDDACYHTSGLIAVVADLGKSDRIPFLMLYDRHFSCAARKSSESSRALVLHFIFLFFYF